MHARQDVPPALEHLARLEENTVTREQTAALGLNRHAVDRLVRQGTWQRLWSGVYVTHPLPAAWSTRAWAGVLIGGDHARLGSTAAGHVHGLVEPPEVIPVLVPPNRGSLRVPGWTFRRDEPGLRVPTRRGSPPRIAVEDAVLDMAAEHSDPERVIALVTNAVQSWATTPPRLAAALARRRRVRHRALLAHLLEDVADGAQSNLEVGYLRDVERAHSLPRGRRQVRRGRTYCDIWYERYGLLVELDGRLGHTGLGRFRDMQRDNSATGQGLATLRYGHADVFGRSCGVATQVAHNLTLRGWTGLMERCRRCSATR